MMFQDFLFIIENINLVVVYINSRKTDGKAVIVKVMHVFVYVDTETYLKAY